MTDRPKYVLCLAYDFPPQGGGAVARIHAFVKYLPQYGYTPIVLTVEPAWYDGFHIPRDETLLQQYSRETLIFRTPVLMVQGSVVQAARARVMGYDRPRPLFAEQIRGAVKFMFHALSIPDQSVFWLPYALPAGLAILRRFRPVAIFATTPLHGVGLIGALLGRIANVPFVLDVRDNWVGNEAYVMHNKALAVVHDLLERFVVATARRVIAVTDESKTHLCRRYPSRSPAQIVCIPNGFDPDNWTMSFAGDGDMPRPSRARLRMMYAGSLNVKRRPDTFLQALALLRGRMDLSSSLEVIFIGTMRPEFQKTIEDYDLAAVVSFRGFRTQAEFVKLLQESDIGIVLIHSREGAATAVPGKTYEYAAAGVHVLAITKPDAAVADLVRRLHLGSVVDVDDPIAIADEIERLISLGKQTPLRRPVAPLLLRQFDRREHARQLAAILDESSAL